MSDPGKVEGDISFWYTLCKIYSQPNKALLIFKGDKLIAKMWCHAKVKQVVIGVEEDICLTESTLVRMLPFYNVRKWRLMIKRCEMAERKDIVEAKRAVARGEFVDWKEARKELILGKMETENN